MEKLDDRLKEFFENESDNIIAFEETYVGNNKICTRDFLMSTEILAFKMETFSKSIQNVVFDRGYKV